MDMIQDQVTESREAILGVSVPDFLRWIEYNVGIKIEFLPGCYDMTKANTIDYLKCIYFDEYCDDKNYAYVAFKEKEGFRRKGNEVDEFSIPNPKE